MPPPMQSRVKVEEEEVKFEIVDYVKDNDSELMCDPCPGCILLIFYQVEGVCLIRKLDNKHHTCLLLVGKR